MSKRAKQTIAKPPTSSSTTTTSTSTKAHAMGRTTKALTKTTHQAPLSKTRVCIKNLPPTTTETDLKEFLHSSSTTTTPAPNLQITDCKILKNAKGKSRKVAFVGFRHADQAAFVVNQYHRTFLRANRITVEPAVTKDDDGADGKSRNAAPSATATPGGGGGVTSIAGHIENVGGGSGDAVDKDRTNGATVEEFLNLMGAGKKSKFWANDVESMQEAGPTNEQSIGNGPNGTEDDSSTSSSDSSSTVDSDDDDRLGQGEAESGTNTKSGLADLDFLRSKQKEVDDLDDDDDNESDKESIMGEDETDPEAIDTDGGVQNKEKDFVEVTKDVESNSSSPIDPMTDTKEKHDYGGGAVPPMEETSLSRLFVRNLPFETTEEELEEHFSLFGTLIECHIPVDDQRRNKGYAFVTFESAIGALKARNGLDKTDFQGRLLHILQARPPPSKSQGGSNSASDLTWKQKQELIRKENESKSGGTATGWSASFVRGDAVVDSLADRLGLRKGDLLGVKDKLSSGDAAVRLALGETQIIEENRDYFRTHGVDMEALVSAKAGEGSSNSKRSKTAIWVKNLPFDTRLEELAKLFHTGDAPVQILLPPSRTIAMVEYNHPNDAKKAFRKLAYRRFKHVPIYLEWAPLGAKIDSLSEKASDSTSTKADAKKSSLVLPHASVPADPAEHQAENDTSDIVSSSIYVKNLNFETSEETLRQVFEGVGVVTSVRIPRKVAASSANDGTDGSSRSLSMGYGFVELPSRQLAQAALKKLQGILVDGHCLELAISSTNQSSRHSTKRGPIGGRNQTKIMVRNVPFQATRKDILKLFGSFGQLKKVRLPKKFDGNHRGFAFVDFLTGKEAQAAMASLSRTHLYGRHLVLEWAAEHDEDIDQLRNNAKRDVGGLLTSAQQPQNKKIRFD